MSPAGRKDEPLSWETIDRMPQSLVSYFMRRRMNGVPPGGLKKPEAVIFDMDGTLVDVSSIRHHVLLTHPENRGYRDYDRFHKASTWCPANLDVVDAAWNHYDRGQRVIVVTARQERYREYTTPWLVNHQVPYHELHMRANDDYRQDAIVKREILERLRIRYEIVQAYDDNPHVLAMWKEQKVPKIVTIPGWFDDEEEK